MKIHSRDALIDRAEALEKELSALPGVRAARVVTSSGRIAEVHLVADGHKSAKQLVRDVQTVAQASLGIDIDYRIISVVHFGDEPIPSPERKVELRSVSWTTAGPTSHCSVELVGALGSARSEARGATAATTRPRLIAQATRDALTELLGDSTPDVSDVGFLDLGDRRVAVALITIASRTAEEVLAGSALVRSDDLEAVAAAILDAFNRRSSHA